MAVTQPPGSSSPSPQQRRLLAVTLGLLLLGGALAVAVWIWARPPRSPGRDLVAEAVQASPFLNVGHDARYADEAACAECHADIARTYARHPMGRSASAVRGAEPAQPSSFTSLGYRFTIRSRRGELIHQAARLDDQGKPIVSTDRSIRFVLGSGTRGKSYLFDLEGCLFQSPISWFEQSRRWDLSPGFHAFYPPEAAVVPACLFCHVNRAEPVPHTRSRYRSPIIDQPAAIGCQRCHGPGELHVEARRRGDTLAGTFDATIVNPRHLPAALRDNVCEQCHLQGEKRILRLGREPFDYRPGLPLPLFWSIFVRKPELENESRAVGHVEQMHASRCFQGSAGRMSCTSCHDPHRQPAPEEKVADFRGRCMSCHDTKPCSLPAAERRRQSAEDSCIQCHMPRYATSDIAHTAVTDHRVPRRPAPGGLGGPKPLPRSGESPIVNYHQGQLDKDDAGADRDLGLALLEIARASEQSRASLLPLAGPLIEKAIRAHPDDVEALEAFGLALAMSGQEAAALKLWQQALKQVPEREMSLGLAAQALQRQGNRPGAITYLSRLVEVNPGNARSRVHLAELLGREGDWETARRQCEAALERDPFSLEARSQLILCFLRTGERERAESELGLLLHLDSGRKEKHQRWFAERVREGGR